MVDLIAARTIPETRQRLEAFQSAEEAQRCPPDFESLMADQLKALSPVVDFTLDEPPDERGQEFIIERVDATYKPVETWRWPIRVERALPRNGTEENWIVRSVVDGIVGFAASADAPLRIDLKQVEDSSRYRVAFSDPRGKAVAIDTAPFVWDPGAYRDVAAALPNPGGRRGPALRAWSSPLSVLKSPTVAAIYSLERQLRAHLSEFPLDPRAHEASALLLGVLGMKYSEGPLTDLRPLLHRMTAHLALASAGAGGEKSIESKLARIILDLLARRERPAQAALTLLKPALREPGLAIWYRSLWMRATKDWRVLPNPATASLLERAEYLRALVRTRDADFAAARLGGLRPEEIPDWNRILLCCGVSVELGGSIAGSAMPLELDEASAIGQLFDPAALDTWWRREGPFTMNQPVPNELWRGLIERSVANAILAQDSYLQSLGDRPGILQFRAEVLENFGPSEVISTIAADWAGDRYAAQPPSGIRQACEAITRLANEAPWRLTVLQWSWANGGCGEPLPGLRDWFEPWMPRGSAFDLKARLFNVGLVSKAAQANWAELSRLAMYDFDILGWTVGRLQNRDPEKRDFEPFGSEFAYNVKPLLDWRRVAVTLGREKDALEPARLACDLEPRECFELLDILRANDLAEEAFLRAERVFKDEGDSVAASHYANWPIDEYVRRGRMSAALDLAERVARTGSGPGLSTKARLMERQGRYAEAQELYRRIDSRYADTSEKGFLARRLARTAPEKKAEIEAALIATGDASNPSDGWFVEGRLGRDGLLFRKELEALGLRPGDIVEAVNGFKVASQAQVRLALSFTDSPGVTLTISRSKPDTPMSREKLVLSGALSRASYEPIR